MNMRINKLIKINLAALVFFLVISYDANAQNRDRNRGPRIVAEENGRQVERNSAVVDQHIDRDWRAAVGTDDIVVGDRWRVVFHCHLKRILAGQFAGIGNDQSRGRGTTLKGRVHRRFANSSATTGYTDVD